MTLCQREQFYQVDLLSPAKVRITDHEYWAQRKGQAKLDAENKEKIEAGIIPDKTEFETEKGFLRRVITATLEDSSTLEEFQKKLFEQYGIAVHKSRGRISYQLPDKDKPIRGRQLGTDFEKEHLLASTQSDFDEKRLALKSTEDRLKTVNQLIKNSGQYLANKKHMGNM